jgi:cytochrome c peroxidase
VKARSAAAVCAALAVLAASACAPSDPDTPVAAPLGLPPVPVPAENPITAAKIELGKRLFFDRRLSFNGTMSCAMCHVPEQGFTSNELGTALGVEGRSLRRNAPTIYNVAYHPTLFHDGRETALENQIWGPLLAANEMANPSMGFVIERARGLEDYAKRFEAVFPGRGLTGDTLGQAIATYERTLVSGGSRFDRWRYRGERDALSAEEQAGFVLFSGKAGCAACHTIGERDALFSDFRYHNTGIGWRQSFGRPASVIVELIPGVRAEVDRRALDTFSEPSANDVGRFEITLEPAERWAYKTPSLRNVALTGPYMHDGSLGTLEDVVEFYDRGGVENEAKSPLVKPLGLSRDEKRALVAFLRSLTGDDIERHQREARAAPVGQ